MPKLKDKLNKIVSNESSKWIDKAEWEISNEGWLDKSAKIALKILNITLIDIPVYLSDSIDKKSNVADSKTRYSK